LQWLQDPSEINGDNLKTVRLEASRYFRNEKREYLKDKINELATNSKNKNIRYLYLLAASHTILNRWKNYFSQLLNVHNVSDVRQIEVHMAETLVPGPSRFEVEIDIAKLLSGIHKLINSIWNKEELPDQWKKSIIVPIHKKG
jgi:hypothetical protein